MPQRAKKFSRSKSSKKIFLTFDSPDDDVMQGSGRIYSSFPWHMLTIYKGKILVNLFFYVRPQNVPDPLSLINTYRWHLLIIRKRRSL